MGIKWIKEIIKKKKEKENMSKPGGKKGAAKATSKLTADDLAERTTPAVSSKADPDVKDDVSSNGDKKDVKSSDEASTATKPQSAGASVRDAAQKLLGLAMKQEWTPVEQVIKSLEKAVAVASDDLNLTPLAGVMDPVSLLFLIRLLIECHAFLLFNQIKLSVD